MQTSLIRFLSLLALAALFVAAVACESTTGIKSIEPTFGNVAGNDDVVIHGGGFKTGMTVHFGKKQVKRVVIESPTSIRVKTPSGPEGAVDVILTDDTGKTYVLKEAFSYRSDISK